MPSLTSPWPRSLTVLERLGPLAELGRASDDGVTLVRSSCAHRLLRVAPKWTGTDSVVRRWTDSRPTCQQLDRQLPRLDSPRRRPKSFTRRSPSPQQRRRTVRRRRALAGSQRLHRSVRQSPSVRKAHRQRVERALGRCGEATTAIGFINRGSLSAQEASQGVAASSGWFCSCSQGSRRTRTGATRKLRSPEPGPVLSSATEVYERRSAPALRTRKTEVPWSGRRRSSRAVQLSLESAEVEIDADLVCASPPFFHPGFGSGLGWLVPRSQSTSTPSRLGITHVCSCSDGRSPVAGVPSTSRVGPDFPFDPTMALLFDSNCMVFPPRWPARAVTMLLSPSTSGSS